MMARARSFVSIFVLSVSCGGGGDGATSARPVDSAKPSAKSAAPPSGSATSSATPAAPSSTASATAAPAPPAPESFGPNVTKEVIEAVNASDAYDTNVPAFAVDGKPTTAWSARPSGAWFEVGLLPGTRVDGIELAGQRTGKNAKGDERWDVNGVLKKVAVEWDGGRGELTFDRAKDKGVRKKLGIGAVTRKLRLIVLEVDRGSQSDDVDVDELAIFGAKGATKAPDKSGLTSLCKAEAVAVRFKDGALYGGEWMPPPETPERSIRWDFTPTTVRVDDGEWHTLGLKYVDNASVDDFNGARVPASVKAVGRVFRFRLDGQSFEAEIDGKPVAGKCGVTMTGSQ